MNNQRKNEIICRNLIALIDSDEMENLTSALASIAVESGKERMANNVAKIIEELTDAKDKAIMEKPESAIVCLVNVLSRIDHITAINVK